MANLHNFIQEKSAKSKKILTYSNDADGYVMNDSSKLIYKLELNREEFKNYRLTGDIKQFFESFDPEKHYVRYPPYDTISENISSYVLSIYDTTIQSEALPSGVFDMSFNNDFGTVLSENKTKTIGVSNHLKTFDLKNEVKSFFVEKPNNNLRKNKKGILLYGNPGNGKSLSIMDLFSLTKEMDIIILNVHSNVRIRDIKSLKPALEGRNLVIILEEITERLVPGEMESILSIMDGDESWDNCVVISTTNYPEELPQNIIDRPGRFEKFIEYSGPTNDQIDKLLVLSNLPLSEGESLKNQNLSFDYVSFIISQAINKGKSISSVYEEERAKRYKISSTFKGRMGIRM